MAFGLYTDAGLTTLLAANIVFQETFDHSELADDVVIYFGSPTTSPNTKVQAASDPGVDQIAVSITDISVGSGQEAANITLSDSADFSGKTPGDPLNLGVEVIDGVGNAAEIHIRFRDSNGAVSTSVELGITTNALFEYEF
jgi:hypothetical protein